LPDSPSLARFNQNKIARLSVPGDLFSNPNRFFEIIRGAEGIFRTFVGYVEPWHFSLLPASSACFSDEGSQRDIEKPVASQFRCFRYDKQHGRIDPVSSAPSYVLV